MVREGYVDYKQNVFREENMYKKKLESNHDLLVKILSFMYNRNKQEYTMSEIFHYLLLNSGYDHNVLYWRYTHVFIPFLERNNIIQRTTKRSPWKFKLLRNGL